MKKIMFLSLLAMVLVFATTPVGAAIFTVAELNGIISGNGSLTGNGDQDVASTAVFTMGADTINITLTNTLVNPKDVAQNLSDLAFYFTIPTGAAPSGTLTSSSGLERTINTNKTYSDGSSVETGWVLSSISGGLYLDVLAGTGHAGPAHTIIGEPAASGKYDNANGSIKGNGPHNPFLAGPVTFIISVPGVTTNTVITGVEFSFGTTHETQTTQVPEPTTLLLLGLGLVGVAGIRRKMKG